MARTSKTSGVPRKKRTRAAKKPAKRTPSAKESLEGTEPRPRMLPIKWEEWQIEILSKHFVVDRRPSTAARVKIAQDLAAAARARREIVSKEEFVDHLDKRIDNWFKNNRQADVKKRQVQALAEKQREEGGAESEEEDMSVENTGGPSRRTAAQYQAEPAYYGVWRAYPQTAPKAAFVQVDPPSRQDEAPPRAGNMAYTSASQPGMCQDVANTDYYCSRCRTDSLTYTDCCGYVCSVCSLGCACAACDAAVRAVCAVCAYENGGRVEDDDVQYNVGVSGVWMVSTVQESCARG